MVYPAQGFLLPSSFSLEEITRCEIVFAHSNGTETPTSDLTPDQMDRFLGMLSAHGYCRHTFSVSSVQSGIHPSVRIFLWTSGSNHLELILAGDVLTVNPLTYGRTAVSYVSQKNGTDQQEAMVSFLAECLNRAGK